MKITNKNYLLYLVIFAIILLLFFWIISDKDTIIDILKDEINNIEKKPSNALVVKEGLATRAGLEWTVYQGYFNDDLRFPRNVWMTGNGAVMMNNLRSITQGALIEHTSQHVFTLELTGYFKPNVSGPWKFKTNSDDASYLWFGRTAQFNFYDLNNEGTRNMLLSKAIVKNPYLHPMVERESGPIQLTAGTYYPIRIIMGENWGGYDLIVSWCYSTGPNSWSAWSSDGSQLLFPNNVAAATQGMSTKGLLWGYYDGYFNDDVMFASKYKKLGSGVALNLSNLSTITGNTVVENVQFNCADGDPCGWKGYSTDNYQAESTDTHYFTIELVGYFKATQSGYWEFFTTSDDASFLWIGDVANSGWNIGNALINNGRPHGMRTISNSTQNNPTGSLYLTEGNFYPIRIQFGEQGGGYGFRVGWRPPGGTWTSNGANNLYNTPSDTIPEPANDHIYYEVTTNYDAGPGPVASV